MQPEFLRRSWFIESFDPPRSVDLPSHRLLQCELELLISLLFDNAMVVHEAMSFDSLAFLEIASEVLAARKRHKKRYVKSQIMNAPFVLAVRRWIPGNDTYTNIIGDRLNNPRFRLSSAAGLSNSIPRRQRLSKLLRAKRWTPAERFLPPGEQVEQLKSLDEYFSEDTYKDLRWKCATRSRFKLDECVRWLASLDSDGTRVDALVEPFIEEFKKPIQEMLRAGVDFSNRSEFRDHALQYCSPEVSDAIHAEH